MSKLMNYMRTIFLTKKVSQKNGLQGLFCLFVVNCSISEMGTRSTKLTEPWVALTALKL